MAVIKSSLENYVINSNEAIEIRLIRTEDDIYKTDGYFKPAMSHQVFGENETIFGYKDLKIKLYYTAGNLTTFFGVTYEDKVNSNLHLIEADNIEKALQDKLQPGYLKNISVFVKHLNEERFIPFGQLVGSFTSGSTYDIYFCDLSNKEFHSFLERLQLFLLWYIDAATFLDLDDNRWHFFIIYERYKHPDDCNRVCHAVAGYTSVYHYFAWPENIRPRISQFLILPPFQRQGLGTFLLQTVYLYYSSQKSVLDVTVESPSEEFNSLCDFVDAQLCKNLSSYDKQNLQKGWNEFMAREAKEMYSLAKKHSQRSYEILKLLSIDEFNHKAMKNYKMEIKKRLKKQHEFSKVKKYLCEEEIVLNKGSLDPKQQEDILECQYEKLLKHYQSVVKKLKAIN